MDRSYILDAQYDARASFYNKARVLENDSWKTLYSYETPICRLEKKDQSLELLANDSLISQTTGRHLKEFLLQEGFNLDSYAGKSIIEKAHAIADSRDWEKESSFFSEFDLSEAYNMVADNIMSVDLYDDGDVRIYTTGRDYDGIAVVENGTDDPIRLRCGNALYGYDVMAEINIPNHDYMMIQADDEGYAMLNAFLKGDFEIEGVERELENEAPKKNRRSRGM